MKIPKKKNIFKLITVFVLSLLIILVIVLYSFPKGIFVDRVLREKNIHLIASKVEETPLKIITENTKLFFKNRELGSFEKITAEFKPFSLYLKAVCKKGFLETVINLTGTINLQAENFSCLSDVKYLSGKLKINEGIKGNIVLKNINIKNFNAEKVELKFVGKEFRGKITYAGADFTGNGRFKLNKYNPLETEVNASFKGSLGNVSLSGKLQSLRIQIR